MALFTTITAVLAAKCTLSYLTECIIDQSSGIALQSIPKLGERLKKQFADTQPEVNGHLQKAILSSHWMATLVFVEQMRKKHMLDEAYNNLYQTVKAELKKLQDKDYHPDEISPDAYDAAKLIKLPKEEDVIRELRASVMQFHLEQLDKKTGNIKSLADYRRFTVFIQDGWAEEKLDWYALMTAFLNQLLKGDNNNAKDSFQNQTLAEIKLKLEDFEKYAGTCMQGIGEERFRGFEETLFTEIALMQESLTDLRKRQEETFNEVVQVKSEILELKNKLGQTRQLDLNLFEHYRSLQADIDLLKMEIDDLERKKKETLEFIQEEENDRKRARFEKDYASFEAEQLQKRFAIDEKQKELDTFTANIQEAWLSVYAKSSPRLIQAREAIEAGDQDAATQILDITALRHDANLIEKLDSVLLQKKESLAQEFIVKANLTLTQKSTPDWFELCDQYYAQAVKLHSSYHTHFAYSHFLTDHKQYVRAEKETQELLKFAIDDFQIGVTFNNLGFIQTNLGDFDRAEESHNLALQIRLKLANSDLDTYHSDVADSMNNLGVLQLRKKEYVQAESSFNEVLFIRRMLYEEDPDTHIKELATVLSNLGSLYLNLNEYENAEKKLQEALLIRRELAELYPHTEYLMDLAWTLNNIGILQRHKMEFIKSEKSFEESLKIRRALALLNPNAFLEDVASTLNGLGDLFSVKNDPTKAEITLLESLSIRRDLSLNNPNAYLSQIATSLDNLGSVYIQMNESEKAMRSLEESLKIKRDLEEVNPKVYLPEIAKTLHTLGMLQFQTNEGKKAEYNLQESLEIYRELAQTNPQIHLFGVALALNSLGSINILGDSPDLNKGESYCLQSLEIFKNLLIKDASKAFGAMSSSFNLALLYRYFKPNREKSMHFGNLCLHYASTFSEPLPYLQEMQRGAEEILSEWANEM